MRALGLLLFPLLAPLVAACSEDADDTGGPLGVSPPALAEGVDFGLPPTVEPHPYSGWFRQENVSEHQSIRHVGRTYTWAETNPAQGVFDWSPLEDDLALAEQEQRGFASSDGVQGNIRATSSAGIIVDHNLTYGESGFADNELATPADGEPGFVDPTAIDPLGFRLQPGSPAIDAGLAGCAASFDFSYSPRPVDGDGDGEAQVDVGAFEYAP